MYHIAVVLFVGKAIAFFDLPKIYVSEGQCQENIQHIKETWQPKVNITYARLDCVREIRA
jgi:hypothetical protein